MAHLWITNMFLVTCFHQTWNSFTTTKGCLLGEEGLEQRVTENVKHTTFLPFILESIRSIAREYMYIEILLHYVWEDSRKNERKEAIQMIKYLMDVCMKFFPWQILSVYLNFNWELCHMNFFICIKLRLLEIWEPYEMN